MSEQSPGLLQWLTAIGTVAIAFFAAFQHHILSWLNTPKLNVKTGNEPPFIRQLIFINENKRTTSSGYAVRLYFRNITPWYKKKTRAEDVEVFIKSISRKTGQGFQVLQDFEPRNVLWSHLHLEPSSASCFTDISPKMERYALIGRMVYPGYTEEFFGYKRNENASLKIDVYPPRNTNDHILWPGTYRLECLIGAENVKAFIKTFEIHISGQWSDDPEKMIGEHISIQEVENGR